MKNVLLFQYLFKLYDFPFTDAIHWKLFYGYLCTGTVNVLLLVLTVMDATAPTVLIMLRMTPPDVKLLMLHWSVIQMHSGLRLGAAHMRIGVMYVLRSKSYSNSHLLSDCIFSVCYSLSIICLS